MTDTDRPSNESVRLITTLTRVTNRPQIIEGETSGTGKTISAPASKHADGQVRLDTETILSGETEYRESRAYELYTPGRLRKRQRMNLAPGPRTGADQVADHTDLPEPTHWPRIEQPDDLPDACPACGSEAAPFQVNHATSPRCEACGQTLEEGQDAVEESGTDGSNESEADERDPLEMSNWERADVLAVEGEGEFLLTRIRGRMATTGAEAVDRAGATYVIRATDMAGPPQLIVEADDESQGAIIVEESDSYTANDVSYAGENTEWLRRWVKRSRANDTGGPADE